MALGCTGGKHRSVAIAASPGTAPGGTPAGSSSGTGTSRRSRAPGQVDRASRRCSRPVTGAEKRCRGSFQPRGLGGRRLAHPRSPSYCEVAREDPVGRTCRMVAAHGGVGVGAGGTAERCHHGRARGRSPWSSGGGAGRDRRADRRELCPRWRRSASSRAPRRRTIRAQMRGGRAAVDHGEGVIVLADLFGGTPVQGVPAPLREGTRRGAGRGESPDAARRPARSAKEQLPLHELAAVAHPVRPANITCASDLLRDASGRMPRPDTRPSGLIGTVRPTAPEPT